MTSANLLHAMGHIDPKLIADAAPDVVQKKPAHKTWVKWASLAACFCFVIMTAVIGRQSSNISSLAVMNYGPFVFVPVLTVSFIPLFISFVRKETTLQSLLITSSISLVVVNLLNILGVYLYSHFGGMNIFGNLPIILLCSNIGAIVSMITIALLERKIKTWWIKLLLWLFIFAVSIILSGFAHNFILARLLHGSITIM